MRRTDGRVPRWLRRVGVAAAVLFVLPVVAVELAYRVELSGVPLPAPPPQELPKGVAEALSLDLTGSEVPRLKPMWPWQVAGFVVLAFVHDALPAEERTRFTASEHRTGRFPTASIAADRLRAAGIRPNFYRRFALEMWISRNWTGSQALAAWAEPYRLSQRARALYGKELSDLDGGELAGLVSFLRNPSQMRKSTTAWLGARRELLRRMSDAGLITESGRATADALPLPRVSSAGAEP